MVDPIRAWLTTAINEGATDVDYYGASQMCAALRAVLDLCEPYGDPPLDATPTVAAIRSAISAALGLGSPS